MLNKENIKKIFITLFIAAVSQLQAQNVGIGTTTPQYRLDVNGRMRIMSGGDVNNTAGLWLNNITNTASPAFIGMQNDTITGIFRNPGGWGFLMNTNTGNIEVGNFNPSRPLSFPATFEKKISLYPGATGDAGFGVFGSELRINSDNSNADITLGYDDYQNGFTERMRIKGNGNVGIGITNPLFKLDMQGQILLRGNGVLSGAPAVFLSNVNGDEYRGKFGKHSTNDSLIGLWGVFGPNDGWALNMNIYNGRIGIGTDNAKAALHVADSSVVFTAPFPLPNTPRNTPVSGTGYRMMWYADKAAFRAGYAFNNSWDKDNIGYASVALGGGSVASGNYSLALNASTNAIGDGSTAAGNGTLSLPNNAVTVLRNGNTGIGNTDPGFRMDINGRMRIRSGGDENNTAGVWLNNTDNSNLLAFIGMQNNNQFGIFGQTGTAGWRFYVNTTDGNAWLQGALTQNSDMRLKKNIQPLSNTISKINQLNGYSYHWKDDNADPSQQMGLLAQELQKVYPQLVKENDKGTLSVNYMGMVPVLLEAIKEQQQQIEKQQKQIDALLKMHK